MVEPKFNEDTLSEKPAIEQLKRMGYVFIPGEKLDPQETEDCERTSRRDVVLVDRLKRKLAELNPEATEETIDKAIRRVTNILGTGLINENKAFHQDLVASVSIEQETGAGKRNMTIKFIDFDDPEKNEFLVVNQFWVKAPKPPDRRPDIVLFVNGIPLVVVECKSPVARDAGIEQAVSDLNAYQRLIPSLFRTNTLLIGVNLFGARYGAIEAAPEDFMEWKAHSNADLPMMSDHTAVREMRALGLLDDHELSKTPAAQDVLIASLLNKRNLLDIIRNFIVFDATGGLIRKKVCRYQQFTAAQKIVKRVLDKKERKGIIWHWQGSGKSLTMVFSALKLRREEKRLKNPFLVILTDRKQLDRQITKTFESCGFPNPIRAESARDLYKLLGGGAGQTIMTTVQKFNIHLEESISENDNIIVLADEAHRSQYGNFAFNLRKALPNAAFFAFTGTPLDQRERNTFRIFSPENETYLDRYTPKQAEEDKATVPIKYSSRMTRLQIVGSSMDKLLEELFPQRTAQELAQIKRQFSTMETLASSPARIERIALDIVEHYNKFISPNHFKAMIVTETREAAVAYKLALDRLIPKEMSRVVITLGGKDDPPEWREKYTITEVQEEELKLSFCDPELAPDFLIVCDKLLTGFDAPNLQVMYIDKRLREHTLLQAVARCNRPYPNKNYGLVVDYAGFGKELAEAVSMFSAEDLEGLFRVDDIERELEQLKERHKAAMAFFSSLSREGDKPKVILQRFVDALHAPDVRGSFNDAYRAFARSMDLLMPDLRVEPYLNDFRFLGTIRDGARTQYRDVRLSMEQLGPKVEALIHAHIVAEGVEEVLQPLVITASDFQEKLNAKPSDKAKASHLESALAATITERMPEDPVFYGSLRKQLQDALDDHRKKRIDDAQLLLRLMPLREQELRKEAFAKSLGLSGQTEFAFFNLVGEMKEKLGLSEKDGQVALAKDIIAALEQKIVTGWTEREDIQKEMRREVKRLLRKKGCAEEDLPHIVAEFMELAQQRLRK
jgi:type I restriction enzyme R subunit